MRPITKIDYPGQYKLYPQYDGYAGPKMIQDHFFEIRWHRFMHNSADKKTMHEYSINPTT